MNVTAKPLCVVMTLFHCQRFQYFPGKCLGLNIQLVEE